MKTKQQAQWVLETLKKVYPDAHCALIYSNPFELLIATILSAQCTDVRVNQVTPGLFDRFPDPQAFADAELAEIEQMIHSTGFFRNKALAIQTASRQLLADHEGQVPNDMTSLTALKGVGRKTASVVMGNAFDNPQGVVVDTHISRLSQRLGLTKKKQPEAIEKDLMRIIPKSDWTLFPHLMIFHGRAICKSRKPVCAECVFASGCPSVQ